jgi:anion-transporting  ArsA/GET3 family ATPase
VSQIDELISKRKILITSGTGGVGKTTISAAMALRSALKGHRTVVITIDPAKRLKTSLGLTNTNEEMADLTPLLHEMFPKEMHPHGSLHAIIPDTEKTFDHFIHSLTSSKETAERVLRNPIFEILGREFSGANEYMAMKRLYSLAQEGKYDTIILDTPPSRNTLAFLDAPKLLSRFFEERFIQWIVAPTNRILSAGVNRSLRILESLTGSGFMKNFIEFSSALFELRFAFSENLKNIIDLIESEETGFLLVSAPTPDTLSELQHLVSRLHEKNLRFDGLILNRSWRTFPFQTNEMEGVSIEEKKGLVIVDAVQKREKRVLDQIFSRVKTPFTLELPELARDVHSLEDLYHVASFMDSSSSS